MLIATLAWSSGAWGQTTSYVLNHPGELTIYSTTASGNYYSDVIEYNIDAPGATLTFEAKGYAKSFGFVGDCTSHFYAQASTNNSSWDDLSSPSKKRNL